MGALAVAEARESKLTVSCCLSGEYGSIFSGIRYLLIGYGSFDLVVTVALRNKCLSGEYGSKWITVVDVGVFL